MANITDYLQWRGDIPFSCLPMGEVDALILSYMAYMPFDGLVGPSFETDMRLGDAAAVMMEQGAKSACMIDSEEDDCKLLYEIQKSVRFGDVRVTGYINRLIIENEEQFSAVTFVPEQGPAFIAFRGTDSTVVGWKEDFNMSFSGEVPSQRNAVYYVQEAAKRLAGDFILGGHSKGGNLAAYAGVFSGDEVQERIACIYNFDGPGFNETVLSSQEFERLDMRIRTYVPQSSMIGILMWHAEAFTVVKSDAISLFQHNPYTWQVMGGKLVTLPERTRTSRMAEQTLHNWLADLSTEQRARFIDGIYDVLSASDGRNVADLFEPRSIVSILRAVGQMDEQTKAAISEALRLLGGSVRELLPGWLDQAAMELRTKIAREKAADREENA